MDIKLEWQRKWREILGEPTDSLPELSCDFALHFDIWRLDDDKLEECFSLFPYGDRLLNRVYEVMKTRPQTVNITDDDLILKLRLMNENIEAVLEQFGDASLIELNNEKLNVNKCSVYRGDETLRREVFKYTDSPTIHLDDDLCQIIKKYVGRKGYEAFYFLSEPLYQLSGCYYTVSHWIAWAMVEDNFQVDPYEPAFELYKMKAQAGWSNEEQFVFILQ